MVGNPLARFIKSHRSQRGLTQKQLAEAAHVSASYVTKIEQGRAPQPGDAVLNRMAEALALDNSDTHTLYMLADRTPPRALNSAPITAAGTNPLINLFRRDHDDVLWSIVDAHLNVIDSNGLYQSSFPGIGDHASFAEWLFRDSRGHGSCTRNGRSAQTPRCGGCGARPPGAVTAAPSTNSSDGSRSPSTSDGSGTTRSARAGRNRP